MPPTEPTAMPVEYSDGAAVEDEVLQLLDAAAELGSARSIAPDRHATWAVRYHLSAERANLLRHLAFEGLDVLELGAGMGGASRFLAERARSLTVVEGTEARFRALRARLRDLHNWRGVVGNVVDVALGRTFDVVCVIGVLEYAELYVAAEPGRSPFARVLEAALRHLADDGVLVLAIENKLGLKYWSGAAEDHLNVPFAGVCDYPRAPSPRTFSRRELRELLAAAGLPEVDEFFPFPDYKVPTSVISADLLAADAELAASIATAGPLDNQSGPRMRLFPEQLAVKSLAKAGLLRDFANSFLLVAARRSDAAARRRLLARRAAGELGWHYAISRRIPVVTTFVTAADGGLEVDKRRLDGGDECHEFRCPRTGTVMVWRAAPRCRLTAGPLLRDRVLEAAYFERWDDFWSELVAFVRWATKTFAVPGEPGHLSGASFDAIHTNAALGADGDYRLFDLEWELRAPLPVSWFVLRNVGPLAKNFEALSVRSGFATLAELYDALCREVGGLPALDADVAREADVRALILASADHDGYRHRLAYAFQRPFGEGFPRIADSDVVPRALRQRWEAEASEREAALRTAEAAIESQAAVGRECQAALRHLEAASDFHRRRADEAERALAAYQTRDDLVTYRLAASAHAFVRRRPWLRGMLKLAERSALRVRTRLARKGAT